MLTSKIYSPLVLAPNAVPKKLTQPKERAITRSILAVVTAVTLTMGFGPALAADVAEYSEATTNDGSLIVYASSWCGVLTDAPDSVVVTLRDVSDDPVESPEEYPPAATARIAGVVLKNFDKEFKNAVTPNGKVKGKKETF